MESRSTLAGFGVAAFSPNKMVAINCQKISADCHDITMAILLGALKKAIKKTPNITLHLNNFQHATDAALQLIFDALPKNREKILSNGKRITYQITLTIDRIDQRARCLNQFYELLKTSDVITKLVLGISGFYYLDVAGRVFGSEETLAVYFRTNLFIRHIEGKDEHKCGEIPWTSARMAFYLKRNANIIMRDPSDASPVQNSFRLMDQIKQIAHLPDRLPDYRKFFAEIDTLTADDYSMRDADGYPIAALFAYEEFVREYFGITQEQYSTRQLCATFHCCRNDRGEPGGHHRVALMANCIKQLLLLTPESSDYAWLNKSFKPLLWELSGPQQPDSDVNLACIQYMVAAVCQYANEHNNAALLRALALAIKSVYPATLLQTNPVRTSLTLDKLWAIIDNIIVDMLNIASKRTTIEYDLSQLLITPAIAETLATCIKQNVTDNKPIKQLNFANSVFTPEASASLGKLFSDVSSRALAFSHAYHIHELNVTNTKSFPDGIADAHIAGMRVEKIPMLSVGQAYSLLQRITKIKQVGIKVTPQDGDDPLRKLSHILRRLRGSSLEELSIIFDSEWVRRLDFARNCAELVAFIADKSCCLKKISLSIESVSEDYTQHFNYGEIFKGSFDPYLKFLDNLNEAMRRNVSLIDISSEDAGRKNGSNEQRRYNLLNYFQPGQQLRSGFDATIYVKQQQLEKYLSRNKLLANINTFLARNKNTHEQAVAIVQDIASLQAVNEFTNNLKLVAIYRPKLIRAYCKAAACLVRANKLDAASKAILAALNMVDEKDPAAKIAGLEMIFSVFFVFAMAKKCNDRNLQALLPIKTELVDFIVTLTHETQVRYRICDNDGNTQIITCTSIQLLQACTCEYYPAREDSPFKFSHVNNLYRFFVMGSGPVDQLSNYLDSWWSGDNASVVMSPKNTDMERLENHLVILLAAQQQASLNLVAPDTQTVQLLQLRARMQIKAESVTNHVAGCYDNSANISKVQDELIDMVRSLDKNDPQQAQIGLDYVIPAVFSIIALSSVNSSVDFYFFEMLKPILDAYKADIVAYLEQLNEDSIIIVNKQKKSAIDLVASCLRYGGAEYLFFSYGSSWIDEGKTTITAIARYLQGEFTYASEHHDGSNSLRNIRRLYRKLSGHEHKSSIVQLIEHFYRDLYLKPSNCSEVVFSKHLDRAQQALLILEHKFKYKNNILFRDYFIVRAEYYQAKLNSVLQQYGAVAVSSLIQLDHKREQYFCSRVEAFVGILENLSDAVTQPDVQDPNIESALGDQSKNNFNQVINIFYWIITKDPKDSNEQQAYQALLKFEPDLLQQRDKLVEYIVANINPSNIDVIQQEVVGAYKTYRELLDEFLDKHTNAGKYFAKPRDIAGKILKELNGLSTDTNAVLKLHRCRTNADAYTHDELRNAMLYPNKCMEAQVLELDGSKISPAAADNIARLFEGANLTAITTLRLRNMHKLSCYAARVVFNAISSLDKLKPRLLFTSNFHRLELYGFDLLDTNPIFRLFCVYLARIPTIRVIHFGEPMSTCDREKLFANSHTEDFFRDNLLKEHELYQVKDINKADYPSSVDTDMRWYNDSMPVALAENARALGLSYDGKVLNESAPVLGLMCDGAPVSENIFPQIGEIKEKFTFGTRSIRIAKGSDVQITTRRFEGAPTQEDCESKINAHLQKAYSFCEENNFSAAVDQFIFALEVTHSAKCNVVHLNECFIFIDAFRKLMQHAQCAAYLKQSYKFGEQALLNHKHDMVAYLTGYAYYLSIAQRAEKAIELIEECCAYGNAGEFFAKSTGFARHFSAIASSDCDKESQSLIDLRALLRELHGNQEEKINQHVDKLKTKFVEAIAAANIKLAFRYISIIDKAYKKDVKALEREYYLAREKEYIKKGDEILAKAIKNNTKNEAMNCYILATKALIEAIKVTEVEDLRKELSQHRTGSDTCGGRIPPIILRFQELIEKDIAEPHGVADELPPIAEMLHPYIDRIVAYLECAPKNYVKPIIGEMLKKETVSYLFFNTPKTFSFGDPRNTPQLAGTFFPGTVVVQQYTNYVPESAYVNRLREVIREDEAVASLNLRRKRYEESGM